MKLLLAPTIILTLLGSTVWAQPDPADDSATAEETGDDAADQAAPDAAELAALRQEYLTLRDRLFRSQARSAAVASALYSSRLEVRLTYKADHYRPRRVVIRLDGASIFEDVAGAVASDAASRFDGYVAPGHHLLNIRIEAVATGDERFTSIIDNTFTIDAPGDGDLIVNAMAEDGGDLASRWETKRRGSYQLHLDVAIEAILKPKGKGAGGGK